MDRSDSPGTTTRSPSATSRSSRSESEIGRFSALAAPRKGFASVSGMGYGVAMRTKSTATELLGRVIAPLGRCLTPAAAKEIVSLQGNEMARRRIEQLAIKCDAGALTPEERAEYQLFVEVGDLVALLQAKARRYLAEHPAA